MAWRDLLTAVFLWTLVGCADVGVGEPTASTYPSFAPTASLTISPSETASSTPLPSETATNTVTPTPTTIPTATWAVQGPGDVTAPILLYHHVDPDRDNWYNVSPENFAEQMQALADWGYTTITISQLAKAITDGAPLPERPIVITFDDGHMSVYNYAFPIMQQYGFFGVNYLVANRLDVDGFLSPSELGELEKAGWEVGSHGFTHSDLTLDHSLAFDEIFYSRNEIEEILGLEVNTFAFPYGSVDNYLYNRVEDWGYLAAVGLGKSYFHNQYSLFYLSRIEIEYEYTLEDFAALLPWSSTPE